MSRNKYDERINPSRAETLQQLETVALGHSYVKKDQVRSDVSIESFALRDRGTLSDNANLGVTREKASDAMPRDRFVIDNQYRQRRGSCSNCAGANSPL